MTSERLHFIAEFLQPTDGEPIRSVITESADSAVVAWFVKPGQRVNPHIHPSGQDTWVILSGTGLYQLDGEGSTKRVSPGVVVVAHRGEVHGVYNDGVEPLQFVSVVAPAASGYEPI